MLTFIGSAGNGFVRAVCKGYGTYFARWPSIGRRRVSMQRDIATDTPVSGVVRKIIDHPASFSDSVGGGSS